MSDISMSTWQGVRSSPSRCTSPGTLTLGRQHINFHKKTSACSQAASLPNPFRTVPKTPHPLILRISARLPRLPTLLVASHPYLPIYHGSNSSLQAPPPRIQELDQRPSRRDHRRARLRRRPLPLGSPDPRARGHAIRRWCLSGGAEISEGLPTGAAYHAVSGGDLASEWYVCALSVV